MSYFDQAIPYLKKVRPKDIPEFQTKYSAAKAKILAANHLFRLMSPEEATVWNKVAPPGSDGISPTMIPLLFAGGGGYTSKWFTFDRPYLFNRQEINVPGGRDGQGMLLTIALGHEMKNTLLKKMLPDVSLQGIPEALKSDSCRCKVEGGTITIGISIPVLEKIAGNMQVEHLGARLVPINLG
ncbi:MAG TPA: hypothetical protein VGN16_22985 [Acidobacteriaceae bacterium]|jgi:hypothetical protein